MKIFELPFFLIIIAFCDSQSTSDAQVTYIGTEYTLDVSSFANGVMEFFSIKNATGIPGVVIMDPLYMPWEYKLLEGFSVSDNEIRGLSKLRLNYTTVNFTDFRVHMEGSIPELTVSGISNVSLFFSYWESSYSISFTDVGLNLDGQFVLNSKGALQTNKDEMQLEMSYEYLNLTTEDLGYAMEKIIETGFSMFEFTLGDWILDWLRGLVDENLMLTAYVIRFPESLNVLDYLMTLVRPLVRQYELDPLPLDPMRMDLGLGIDLQCENISLEGLSTVYWANQAYFTYIDDTLQFLMKVRTQSLKATGKCGVLPLSIIQGPVEIQVEYFELTVEVHSPTDLKSPPFLRDLSVELGNIDVRMSSLWSLDYALEAMANIVPNLIREQIQKAIEGSLWKFLQAQLSKLDLRCLLAELQRRSEKFQEQQSKRVFVGDICHIF